MNYTEAINLLKTAKEVSEVDRYRDELAEVLPCIKRMFGYDQQNQAHQYDLWMHCLHTVLGLPKDCEDDMVYLAALLHDIGKPDCQVKGKKSEDSNMHYYGHQDRSYEIVRDTVIPFLLEKGEKMTQDDQRRLLYYVKYHDDRVSLRIRHLRRHLQIPVSFQEFQNLMLLQVADANAHVMLPIIVQRAEICGQLAGEYGKELFCRIQAGE